MLDLQHQNRGFVLKVAPATRPVHLSHRSEHDDGPLILDFILTPFRFLILCERNLSLGYIAQCLLPSASAVFALSAHETNAPKPQNPGRSQPLLGGSLTESNQAICLNVLPLAVLRSFSSLSGRALRRTVAGQFRYSFKVEQPVYTLQEVRRPPPHARVDVGLGSLDMVVEVVAEGLDVGDDIRHPLRREMSGEEHYRGN